MDDFIVVNEPTKSDYEHLAQVRWDTANALFKLQCETMYTPSWVNRFFRWMRGPS